MGDSPYEKTKNMPPLRELAKRAEQERDPTGNSKGKQRESRGQEGWASKSTGEDAAIDPKLRQPHVKHSKRVDFELKQFLDEMDWEGEEEEDNSMDTSTNEGVKRLPRKRTFQESQMSHSDDSPSELGRAEESRKNIPYTGGQPGVADQTSGSWTEKEEWEEVARQFGSQATSGKVRSEGLSAGTPAKTSDTLRKQGKPQDSLRRG